MSIKNLMKMKSIFDSDDFFIESGTRSIRRFLDSLQEDRKVKDITDKEIESYVKETYKKMKEKI